VVFCFRPTRLKETGTQFALRLSLLPSRPITALLPPKCAVKTVADLKKLKIRKKDDEAFSAEAASKNPKKKKTHDVK
jgi:hypothetical protein